MEITELDLRKNTGTVSDNLRAMAIGEEYALDVAFADAANIRGLITQIHKQGKGYQFSTKKIATGIKVWRVN